MKTLQIALAMLALSSSGFAQDETPTFKLNVNVDLVEIHVTVVDDKDRPVGGLLQENFAVTENAVDQPISVFKHEDIPVSLGLVIDNSRSIEPRKERMDAAALSFVQKGNPEDETFVVHFDFDARLAKDFTHNIPELEHTLAAVKPYGQTALYDAVILAVEHMQQGQNTKKALLVISDGIDNASKHTLNEAVETVKRGKVLIYTVGLLSESGGDKAENDLLQFAEASGGRAYFPENVEQARTMMEGIARDLREQYTLGYFPTSPARTGDWRSVRVDIKPPKGIRSRLVPNYRHGYYGPDDH